MKTRILLLVVVFSLVVIPVTTNSFAEESFDGHSSIDPPLSKVFSGQSIVMNVKFWYTSGPYSLNNFAPIIEISPSSAEKFVEIKVDSLEITQWQIKRIPVTLTIDPHIEHEKIFLSISYTGNHFKTDELYKSSWNDQVTLDVIIKDRPVPEPEQDKPVYENCGPGTILQEGICVDTGINDSTNDSGEWINSYQNFEPPLKQIKNGVSLVDIKCNEGKVPSYKGDRMRVACVSEETQSELWVRGWATMRLISPGENISHALCNNYEGKWLAEYKECELLENPLQCSLLGGVYNECASACRHDPDFPNVVCTDNCVEICSIESFETDK